MVLVYCYVLLRLRLMIGGVVGPLPRMLSIGLRLNITISFSLVILKFGRFHDAWSERTVIHISIHKEEEVPSISVNLFENLRLLDVLH